MGPFHIFLDEIGLDQRGLDQRGLDKVGRPHCTWVALYWAKSPEGNPVCTVFTQGYW